MKILVANYRYFVSGGPERYMFNVTDALRVSGHEVIPFSIRYRQNEPSPYSDYFVPPLGAEDEVYFRDHRMSPSTLLATMNRLFFSQEVRSSVRRLVADTRPDVAYVLHYLRKLSPSLLVALKEEGIPIVVRLSDYQMLCPQAHLLRNGKPCSLCVGGNILPSVQHKCIQGSLPASAINALATWFHRYRGYFDLVDRFVVTNGFMYEMLRNSGVSGERISHIPTFVQPRALPEQLMHLKQDVVVYVGRLDYLKGVHILIEAVGTLKIKYPEVGWSFKIAGDGNPDYVSKLHARVDELDIADRIEFCGSLDIEGVFALLASSRIQVVPSLWYENLPNSLLEGYASCTPVVASDLGSLSATVVEGRTGFLFDPGNPESLAAVLAQCWQNKGALDDIGFNARILADTEYSERAHLEKLTSLFGVLLN
jgi:glycosyltransferase involved in cell wall biosynthesis